MANTPIVDINGNFSLYLFLKFSSPTDFLSNSWVMMPRISGRKTIRATWVKVLVSDNWAVVPISIWR